MYLAVVAANSENRLTKYQPFELEADAIAHVSEYGGFVSIDPEGVQALWIVDMVSKTIVRDTAVEATVATELALAGLRTKRDQLLHDTDWWASSDLSISESQTTYRQALRDLPANTPDPTSVTWPVAPGA